MSKSIEDRIAAATGKLSSMMREMAAENGDMTEEEMFAAMTANKVRCRKIYPHFNTENQEDCCQEGC